MITIGIDIGITGAIGAVYPDGHAKVVDLPTVEDGKSRRLDGRKLILALRDLVPADGAALVLFEDVRPRPNPSRGTSIVTEGGLMRSRGIVEAVLDITRFEVKVVQPQTWKRWYGLIKSEKNASLEKARVLFPGAATELKRVKDHNRAESLLIAHYGHKVLA